MQRISLNDILVAAGLAKFLKLLPPDAFIRVSKVLAEFPGNASRGFLAECRLERDSASVDLSIQSFASGGERQVLEKTLERLAHAGWCEMHPAWECVRRFVRDWNDQQSPLYKGISNIWLEFDSPKEGEPQPPPSLFFHVYSAPGTGEFYPAPLAVVEAGLGNLLSFPGAPRLSERFLRQIERLITGTEQSFYCGVMLARESSEIRVIPRALHSENVASYLCGLGLPYQSNELDEMLCLAQSGGGRVFPALTLRGELSPDYGLECFLKEAQWPELLERLTAQGKCAPEKRDELLGFDRVISHKENATFWPESFAALEAWMPSNYSTRVIRSLSHVKLAIREGMLDEAKAYLAARYAWSCRK